jgi:hypothetical protein
MNVPSDDSQGLGFWDQIKIRLEPVGVSFLVLGVGALLGAAFAPISIDLRTTLLGISLALVSVGLGLVAIGISAKSDLRYSEILSKIDAKLTRVLRHVEPSVDKFELPSDLSKNVVIEPPVATAYADVATRVEVITPEMSRARAQARLDADTKEVGYVRGEVFQKEDGSWAVHWGGKYPL